MAMDREKLLAYFQAHYLSRQEVLFKLPLNISIDSFWPELLSRRKARATVLPLNNAAGMPYWYVLTDKMVAASERLCSEAMEQDAAFDPYRADMTSAMTEEMFFTSFVEGAQIPLQEAMDFLQRGTEPESIQEQMIWNNRRAWGEMIATLYRPLDEGFVRSLAFMLTEEMDGCAEDYRQSDQHPIAAMNNETCEVPPAFALPDRMNEYYAFLQDPGVHPLIKAAVAQAYLLVVRPFPEGNERLSRMMSSAVLLRCGYDFFRDISISAVIARESYRYYKCMREIIRGENGGDLTYFVEYYLDLLVRALDARKERLQRRERENLEREREMAREPLVPDPWSDRSAHSKKGTFLHPADEKNVISPSQHKEASASSLAFPSDVSNSPGIAAYNETDESHPPGMPPGREGFPRDTMLESLPEEAASCFQENLPPLEERLRPLDGSCSALLNQAANEIRKMLAKGITSFNRKEFTRFTGFDLQKTRLAIDSMIHYGIIQNTRPRGATGLYLILCDAAGELQDTTELIEHRPTASTTQEYANSDEWTPDVDPDSQQYIELLDRLREKSRETSRPSDLRIYQFFQSILKRKSCFFTKKDWCNEFHTTETITSTSLRRIVNLGYARRQTIGGQRAYVILPTPPPAVRDYGLTEMQTGFVTNLYRFFRNDQFTIRDCLSKMDAPAHVISFQIQNFVERDILQIMDTVGGLNYYQFTITPETHPKCFASESSIQSSGRRNPPSRETVPLAATSA